MSENGVLTQNFFFLIKEDDNLFQQVSVLHNVNPFKMHMNQKFEMNFRKEITQQFEFVDRLSSKVRGI